MKARFLLSLILLFLSLYGYAQSKKYNKLAKLIPPSEEVIQEGYTYIKTVDTTGVYIIRVYIPETQQITSITRYADEYYLYAEGYAKEWFHEGSQRFEGNYQNNRAIGLWTYYHRSTGAISSKGQMINGFKHGRWKHYDENGNISSVVNYIQDVKEGPFVEYDSLKTVINSGEYKSDTIFTQTKIDTTEIIYSETLPFMKECEKIKNIEKREKCSNQTLFDHIYKNIKYPPNAKSHGLQGKTYAQFTITKDGKLEDLKITESQCQEFIDEVTRLIKKLPEWSPGLKNGKPVDFLFTLPIEFRLK